MSLLVAIPCGLGAAIAYGASTAVEHAAAHTDESEADARGLIALLRNPRWLLGMAGDTLGLVLQVVALSTGSVVLIQPLLVLALPVSLPIGWAIGGPRPARRDYYSCALIIAALAVFFAIVGNPGTADVLETTPAVGVLVGFAVVGALACVAVRRRPPAIRALTYGAVSGAWFGLVSVFMDATATAWRHGGLAAFAHARALVPLVGLLALGGASIALTQVALQVGALAASFPANLTADPVVAVILGAALLHENLPVSAPLVVVYLVCLGAIVYGAVRLAQVAEVQQKST